MLDSLERYVLLYDLKLRTARREVEFPAMEELALAMKQRVDAGKSRIELPAYEGGSLAPWLRIKKARIDTHQGKKYLQLLLSVGDPRAANPSFEHSETAALRTVEKLEKEGKALTAHCTIALQEAPGKRYRMVVEDIRGLGRTRVQELLAHELKALSEEFGLEYTNNSGDQVETYIIPTLEGYRAEKIRDSLKRSTLSGVWLIDTKSRTALDEVPNAKIARREIKVDVSDKSMLSAVAQWGASKKYDRMRLIWNDPKGAGKPERASVEITQQDVQDTYFVRQYKIKLNTPLDEASTDLRDDVLTAMRKQIRS
jgi:hypothetical protein